MVCAHVEDPRKFVSTNKVRIFQSFGHTVAVHAQQAIPLALHQYATGHNQLIKCCVIGNQCSQ